MSSRTPVQIAVIGASPAGIHAAEMAICNGMRPVRVDIIDQRPFIPGLARPHIEFERTTQPLDQDVVHPHLRFIGNVTVNQDLPHTLLDHYYDAVISTVSDIPGLALEELQVQHLRPNSSGDLVVHLREAGLATTSWLGWYRLDDSVRKGQQGWQRAVAAAHGIPVVP